MLDHEATYASLLRIRRFEETVLDRFSSGVFYGTTHTYLGQEANAVGVVGQLEPGDIVVSNHRCHGHFLAYGGDPRALFAELMGRSTGVCGGIGGSQHLQWRDFYSNGILGGTAPLATGMALAEARKGTQHVAVVFLGDGALGEGVVYETLNMAALWRAPVLYVVEHNGIAQTTPTELALAGDPTQRFEAFGVPAQRIDTSDVLAVAAAAGPLLAAIRRGDGPRGLVIDTHRFGPHSKGDDTRDPALVARAKAERDPVAIHGARLDGARQQAVTAVIEQEVAAAFEQALADPPAALEPRS